MFYNYTNFKLRIIHIFFLSSSLNIDSKFIISELSISKAAADKVDVFLICNNFLKYFNLFNCSLYNIVFY